MLTARLKFAKFTSRLTAFAFLSVLLVISVEAQKKQQSFDNDLPSWTKKTGAHQQPKSKKIFSANSFGAKGDGATDSTEAIQKAIDEASKKGGIVTFEKGVYVT